MNFESEIDLLKKRIALGLPGRAAHIRMIPTHRMPEFEMNISEGRKSAALLLLYPKESSIFTVFIKRPQYEGFHSGQISLPGGKYQEEDGDLKQTALREAFEETGIIPTDVTILTQLTELFIPPSNFILTPFIGYQTNPPHFVPEVREVAEIIEADISLFNPSNLLIKDITLHNGRVVQTPYYQIGEHVIWGATGMLMREFEELYSTINREV